LFPHFFGIFSDPSDQARLVIVGLSLFVGLIIVWANQSANNRRAKRELLISKLDELYSEISACDHKFITYLPNIELKPTGLYEQSEYIDYDKQVLDVTSSINSILKYFKLYFTNYGVPENEIKNINMLFLDAFGAAKGQDEEALKDAVSLALSESIEYFDSLFLICNEITNDLLSASIFIKLKKATSKAIDFILLK